MKVPCEICRHFYPEVECPRGTHASVAIGLVCRDCKEHTQVAFDELAMAPGIIGRPMTDCERRAGK